MTFWRANNDSGSPNGEWWRLVKTNFRAIAIICDYLGLIFRDGRTRKSEPLETFFSWNWMKSCTSYKIRIGFLNPDSPSEQIRPRRLTIDRVFLTLSPSPSSARPASRPSSPRSSSPSSSSCSSPPWPPPSPCSPSAFSVQFAGRGGEVSSWIIQVKKGVDKIYILNWKNCGNLEMPVSELW